MHSLFRVIRILGFMSNCVYIPSKYVEIEREVVDPSPDIPVLVERVLGERGPCAVDSFEPCVDRCTADIVRGNTVIGGATVVAHGVCSVASRLEYLYYNRFSCNSVNLDLLEDYGREVGGAAGRLLSYFARIMRDPTESAIVMSNEVIPVIAVSGGEWAWIVAASVPAITSGRGFNAEKVIGNAPPIICDGFRCGIGVDPANIPFYYRRKWIALRGESGEYVLWSERGKLRLTKII